MCVGETRVVAVHAHRRKNRTAVLCEAGASYSLTTSPLHRWLDLNYTTDARGTDLRHRRLLHTLMEPFRSHLRSPDAPWMALLVDVEGAHRPQTVGYALRLDVTGVGELIAYANEVPGFYWNNRGMIPLHVTRQR